MTTILCDTCGAAFVVPATGPITARAYERTALEAGWTRNGTYEDGSPRWTCPDAVAHEKGVMAELTRAVRAAGGRVLNTLVDNPEAREKAIKLGKELLERLRRQG